MNHHSDSAGGRAAPAGPTTGEAPKRGRLRITPPWLDASPDVVSVCDAAAADWNASAAGVFRIFDDAPNKAPLPPPACYEANMAPPARAGSAVSFETYCASSSAGYSSSSAGCSLSPVQTERSDIMTVFSRDPSCVPVDAVLDGHHLVCLGPRCQRSFASEEELAAHVQTEHTHVCSWAGCGNPGFASHDGLVWHVKAEHLLVCPSPGCTETSFQSTRVLTAHISVAHPETGKDGVAEWQLTPSVRRETAPVLQRCGSSQSSGHNTVKASSPGALNATVKQLSSVVMCKRRCQEQLRSVVEKKAKKAAGTPKAADSPTDLVRSRASRLVETASFPLVFEHAVLPFLAEVLPAWSGPRHVVSVSRGRAAHARRICIMTRWKMSRARKVTLASHVRDLLPDNFRRAVTFVFSVGQVDRIWARGLGPAHKDEVCAPRNPYFFQSPCMGDSIGIPGNGVFDDSTATLGPCLNIDGASFWLGNFHPFLDAYRCLDTVEVEHPSSQDRSGCIGQAHDAMAPEDDFRVGSLSVTSGLNLRTTRISHDPYWEDCCQEPPLVVTDWALIAARASPANILRRFPSETQAGASETPVTSTAAVPPGAPVVSSGRTSGHQRGQVCEVPAYVSGDENGTQKATREWFVEEPCAWDDEDAWIRGGIGVEGDSGAAVVDADSGALVGQLWGRNRYFGPGPRHAYFTPIADVFDDIQEKCGQQARPRLPQERDEADRYAVYPSCRQCYDLRTYLESRRSSRMSLQSMIMGPGAGDGDQDLTSIEALSELATPRDYQRYVGVEEAGSSFNGVPSPLTMTAWCPGTPVVPDARTPYAPMLDVDDLYDSEPGPSRKRAGPSYPLALFAVGPDVGQRKRQRAG